ncbi:hypothetical protein E3N88_45276 [Mikania micrantha]|uniref:FAR1 domain-containing protein n=1 Tax=Mikania micrantha TaxID=192012 RepID=A0A5N6L9L4_9ASTR|nr:hypothetical protein E3N88_45276 [Mikania micrantha]
MRLSFGVVNRSNEVGIVYPCLHFSDVSFKQLSCESRGVAGLEFAEKSRGVDNGYIVVTARSKKKGDVVKKVWLVCDRSGEHKTVATRRSSGSKKIGCPFKLVGVYNEKRLVWQLEVRNDEHNHEAAQHLEGHPFVRRLSQDEHKMVGQLTEQHMDPRNILSIIKKQNPDNVSRRSCNKCRRGSVPLSSEVVHILASIPACADD